MGKAPGTEALDDQGRHFQIHQPTLIVSAAVANDPVKLQRMADIYGPLECNGVKYKPKRYR